MFETVLEKVLYITCSLDLQSQEDACGKFLKNSLLQVLNKPTMWTRLWRTWAGTSLSLIERATVQPFCFN